MSRRSRIHDPKIRTTPPNNELTRRERQVVDDLMLGHSTNREIAASVGIDIETVKYHLSNAYVKYGVENRVQLILAETERLEKLKCQVSAPAQDKKLTPRNTSRSRHRRQLEELRKTLPRRRRSRAALLCLRASQDLAAAPMRCCDNSMVDEPPRSTAY